MPLDWIDGILGRVGGDVVDGGQRLGLDLSRHGRRGGDEEEEEEGEATSRPSMRKEKYVCDVNM